MRSSLTRFAAATSLCLLAAGSARPGPPEDALRSQIQAEEAAKNEAERELRRLEEEIRRLEQAGTRTRRSLEIAEKRVRRAEALVRRERARLAASDSKLKALTRQITETEIKLKNFTGALARRARALFRVSRGAGLEVLLSAEDATDLALRARFLSALSRDNAGLVEKTRGERSRLRTARASAEEERRERQKAVADLQEARRKVEEERRSLSAERMRIRRLEQEAKAKAAQARRLIEAAAARIRALRSQVDAARNVYAIPTGRWRAPVHGRRYTDVPPGLSGVYFEAPAGTSVKAAAEGEVGSVEEFRGLGVTVILIHGGGYTSVYGNLTSSSVRRGARIAAGQAIGTSGRSPYGEMLFFSLYRDGRSLNTASEIGL